MTTALLVLGGYVIYAIFCPRFATSSFLASPKLTRHCTSPHAVRVPPIIPFGSRGVFRSRYRGAAALPPTHRQPTLRPCHDHCKGRRRLRTHCGYDAPTFQGAHRRRGQSPRIRPSRREACVCGNGGKGLGVTLTGNRRRSWRGVLISPREPVWK